MTTWRYFLHALSPLHVGTGEGEGLIDLPIVRDPATGHPLVPGSSTKGVLREAATHRREPDVSAVFGPDTSHAHEHAGALRVSDARVVLMPVKSDAGTFAWVTSPWVLARLLRDLDGPAPFEIPTLTKGVRLAAGSALREDSESKVALGGDALAVGDPLPPPFVETLAAWLFEGDAFWSQAFRERLALVPDDTFSFFARHATDVRAHIHVEDETGTVADGGLWYEESLPAETILAGFLQAAPNGRADAARVGAFVTGLHGTRLQIGGNATTGMGVCRFVVREGGR